MSRRVRIAIVGAGRFVEQAHLPGLRAHPAAEIALLCGRDPERTASTAARLDVPAWSTNVGEAVRRDDVDAVTICTPNVVHREIALAALSAGKHVFCEKPLGMTVAEAAEMAAAARASGLIHHVAFILRHLHGIGTLRRLVRAGEIGPVVYARARGGHNAQLSPTFPGEWRHRRDLAGGGMLFDVGSHYLDLIRWIVGPVAEVCALQHVVPRQLPDRRGGAPVAVDTDDLSACLLRLEDGTPGEVFTSRVIPNRPPGQALEVSGTAGTMVATLSRGNDDSLTIAPPGEPARPVELPAEASAGRQHAVSAMMGAFVDAILRGRSDPDRDGTFEDGLAVQRVLAAVDRAARERRWVPVADAP